MSKDPIKFKKPKNSEKSQGSTPKSDDYQDSVIILGVKYRVLRREAPGTRKSGHVRVVSTLRSMRGFVTSKRSDQLFESLEEAAKNIETKLKKDPNLEMYQIYDERDYQDE